MHGYSARPSLPLPPPPLLSLSPLSSPSHLTFPPLSPLLSSPSLSPSPPSIPPSPSYREQLDNIRMAKFCVNFRFANKIGRLNVLIIEFFYLVCPVQPRFKHYF